MNNIPDCIQQDLTLYRGTLKNLRAANHDDQAATFEQHVNRLLDINPDLYPKLNDLDQEIKAAHTAAEQSVDQKDRMTFIEAFDNLCKERDSILHGSAAQ